MTRITVYVETSEEALSEGGCLAHVPELPGCAARGPTKDAAIAGVRGAIAEVAERLRSCGLPAPDLAEGLELEVTETQDSTLPTDYEPLGDADLGRIAALARASRESMIELLDDLTLDELRWSAGEDDWQLQWIVAHVAGAELWYASRLEDGPKAELSWRLQATRDMLLGRLLESPVAHRGRVTRHGDEDWTPRKAARRMLEHEYEHLQQLRAAREAYRRSKGREDDPWTGGGTP